MTKEELLAAFNANLPVTFDKNVQKIRIKTFNLPPPFLNANPSIFAGQKLKFHYSKLSQHFFLHELYSPQPFVRLTGFDGSPLKFNRPSNFKGTALHELMIPIEAIQPFPLIRLSKRQIEGKSYWNALSLRQRTCLLESHGGFSDKYSDMPYQHLTQALQQICNEAAITPGGIVSLKRLIQLKVLNGESFRKPLDPWYWGASRLSRNP